MYPALRLLSGGSVSTTGTWRRVCLRTPKSNRTVRILTHALSALWSTSHYGRQMIANVGVLWSYSHSVEDFWQGCCGREKWWWIEEHFNFIRRHVLFYTNWRYRVYRAEAIPQSSAHRIRSTGDGLVRKHCLQNVSITVFFISLRERSLVLKYCLSALNSIVFVDSCLV